MSLEKDINYLMDKLNIARETALDLIKFDQPNAIEKVEVTETKKRKKKTGITEDELVQLKDNLKLITKGEKFQNKDISGVIEEEFGIGPRALPSRLKKLVEQDFLEDLGGSPKTYKVK